MKLHRKYSIGLTLLVGLVLFFIIAPALSGQSWLEQIKDWVDEYVQAVDEADVNGEAESQDVASLPLTVSLDDDVLDYIGIETEQIHLSEWASELKTHAYVVDSSDLVKWRSRLNQAQAAVMVARVAEQSALSELQRLQKLAKAAGSVASKNINYAEAAWKEKKAGREATQVALDDIKAEFKQAWGNEIAGWVLDRNGDKFTQVLNRKQALLLLSLPLGTSLPEDNAAVYVSISGSRSSAQPAFYVSPAYPSVSATQAETYYFLTEAEHLRPGMQLDAWISEPQKSQQGFFIPETAIVWYAGQPWAYIEVKDGTFKRKTLASGIADEHGIFMPSEFSEGDALVVSGSQMLLSEEFRWQIHDEEDDD